MQPDSRYGQLRLTLSLYILVLVFGIQLYQSWTLWLPDASRTFPIMPIWSSLPDIGAWSGAFLLPLLLGMLGMLYPPLRFYSSLLALAGLLGLFAFDVLRAQAWAVQYAFFLLLLGYSQFQPRQALRALHLLLACTYIWSGIHKIGPHFLEAVFPWFMSVFDFSKKWSESLVLAYAFGAGEALMGLFLLFGRKLRVVGLVGISLMHLLILSVLIKDDWNHIVWGWNIAMVLWLWIIVLPSDGQQLPWRRALRKWPVALVAIWMGLLPGLYLFGLWEHNLSLAMYSGMTTEAYLIIEEPAAACLSPQIQEELTDRAEGDKQVLLDYWTLNEMQVPTYPKGIIFERFLSHFCSCLEKYDAMLYLYIYDHWSTEKTQRFELRCQNGQVEKREIVE